MKRLPDFLRHILLENWWLKLAGILLAYILWLLVRSGEGERSFTVPLILHIPRNMEIVNDHPNTVAIAALVAPHLVDRLPDLSCTIDLQSAGEGEQVVPLSPASIPVGANSGITVVRVNPPRIALVLERVISKDVRVRVPIQGNPAAGFQVDGVTCRPDIVHIIGPRSKINMIEEAETDPVVVTGKKNPFHTTVNFSLQHVDIHTSPETVEVTVAIGVHLIEKTLRGAGKR